MKRFERFFVVFLGGIKLNFEKFVMILIFIDWFKLLNFLNDLMYNFFCMVNIESKISWIVLGKK